jgi:hypothetical protein
MPLPVTGHRSVSGGQHIIEGILEAMTLSIELPESALARLRAEAARRGLSVDELVTELADQLPAEQSEPVRHRRLSFAGTLSAEPDFAERSEEILDEIIRRAAG